jgi:hypothetical protein
MQGIKAAMAASCSLGQGGNNLAKQNYIFVFSGRSRHSPDILKMNIGQNSFWVYPFLKNPALALGSAISNKYARTHG